MNSSLKRLNHSPRADRCLQSDVNVTPNWHKVVATGAGTGRVEFQINLTSRCACDGACVPHPTRPYHDKGNGRAILTSFLNHFSHLSRIYQGRCDPTRAACYALCVVDADWRLNADVMTNVYVFRAHRHRPGGPRGLPGGQPRPVYLQRCNDFDVVLDQVSRVFLALRHPARAVWYPLSSAHVHRTPTGACNPVRYRHFTSSGTSCGRGVELVDCKRACDAATQPQCTSFTFTAGTGLCFLFANGGCATCATSTVFGTFFHKKNGGLGRRHPFPVMSSRVHPRHFGRTPHGCRVMCPTWCPC